MKLVDDLKTQFEELRSNNEELVRRLNESNKRVGNQRRRIAELEHMNKKLRAKNKKLEARCAAIDDIVNVTDVVGKETNGMIEFENAHGLVEGGTIESHILFWTDHEPVFAGRDGKIMIETGQRLPYHKHYVCAVACIDEE